MRSASLWNRKAEPKRVHVRTTTGHARATRVGEAAGAARTKLARRQSNPLDAQAMDTRVQTWPCKSGGICNWKRLSARRNLRRVSAPAKSSACRKTFGQESS